MTALAIVFWVAAALLVYAQVGYGLLLALFGAFAPAKRRTTPRAAAAGLPRTSVIVAAYAEERVIAERVANLRALDYPRERLELIVVCDGSPDSTARRAREAGADVVLELPRGGKIRAQDGGVQRALGEIVAFSDANVSWDATALRELIAPFADP